MRGRVGDTFIKDHGDVRAKNALDLHCLKGTDKVKRTIDMGPEMYAIFFYLSES